MFQVPDSANDFVELVPSLKLTFRPGKIGHLKRKQVFQPSIFRCELFPFREGTCLSLPPPSSGVKKSHSPMLLRFVVPHLPKYPNWNLKTSENRTVTLKLQKKTCLLAKSTKKWLIDTDFIGAIWMFICYYAHLRAAFEAFFPHAAAPVTKTSPHPPPPPPTTIPTLITKQH